MFIGTESQFSSIFKKHSGKFWPTVRKNFEKNNIFSKILKYFREIVKQSPSHVMDTPASKKGYCESSKRKKYRYVLTKVAEIFGVVKKNLPKIFWRPERKILKQFWKNLWLKIKTIWETYWKNFRKTMRV